LVDTNIPQKLTDEIKRSAMRDYTLMMCVPFVVSVFLHGFNAILNVTISLITCWFFTVLGKKLLNIEFPPKTHHPFVIGMGVALLLPASAPWWMIILTTSFAMGVCVLPFGNPENAPFIPSVSALCFATLCWSEETYNYSDFGNSLGRMLLFGNSIDDNIIAVLEVLVGKVPSALGTGCIIAFIGLIIFIIIRRPKDSIAVFTFIGAVCLMAILFPRVATGRVISVIMELCSGMILFGAIFFISSPFFAPKRTIAKFFWGFASGIICMIIRYVCPFEEGACFGFLVACGISDLFDGMPLTIKEKKQINALAPYIETEAVPSVVPEEVLEQIPDVPVFEVIIPDSETEETEEKTEIGSESLETLISEENAVSQQDSPFFIGGDSDEG
jgi:electron transport complex protein RnfD